MKVNKIIIIESIHNSTPIVPVADVLPVPDAEIISANENLYLLSAVLHIK
jgi:hypothetical protein